jgi:hypothetical protein
MTKNEDNMKKALMRGVCALNLEAMSILNESNFNNNTSLVGNNHIHVSKKNPPQTLPLNEPQENANNNNNNNNRNAKQLVSDLKENIDTRGNLNSLRDQAYLRKTKNISNNENELTYDPVLNRKVKEYCEFNLKLSNINDYEKNDESVAALKTKSKSSEDIDMTLKQSILAKKPLINHRNSVPNDQQNFVLNRIPTNNNSQRFVEEIIIDNQGNNFSRKEKVFEELFQHPDPQSRQKNLINSKKLEVKSKIGSLPPITANRTHGMPGVFHQTTLTSIALATQSKPVLVEKHNELASTTDAYNRTNKRSTNETQSYSTCPPFTVLNTRSLSK